MGNYEIAGFKANVQAFIKENDLDKDKSGFIEKENGELASLLSAMNEDNVENLLDSTSFKYSTNTDSNLF